VQRHVPEYEAEYERRGWKMFHSIARVYVNQSARRDLGWEPQYDFKHIIDRLMSGDDLQSPLARLIGSKGYHRVSADVPQAEPRARS
jgi:UDP-glucose 4-epimerase